MRSLKSPLLHRYWIELDRNSAQDEPRLGALLPWGVTAYSLHDALSILRDHLLDGEPLRPPLRRVIEDVDLSKIDPFYLRHGSVFPPIWRGIWYPYWVLADRRL